MAVGSARNLSLRSAEQFLQRLGQLAHRDASDESLTWGLWLTQATAQAAASSDDSTPKIPLLIDRRALELARVESTTEVGSQTPDTLWNRDVTNRSQAILDRAHLVLLAHPSGLVLSSLHQVSLLRDQLQATDISCLILVKEGRLASAITTRRHMPASGPLVTPEHWRDHPARRRGVPWLRGAGKETQNISSWSGTALRPTTGQTITVHVVRRSSMFLLGTLVFLLTLGLMTSRFFRRPAATIGILAAVCIAALIASPSTIPLTSSVLLGILVSVATNGLRRSRSSPAVLPAITRLLAMVICFASVPLASAQETVSVLIPIDDKLISADSDTTRLPLLPTDVRLRPVGGKVYVPEVLFQALHRRADESSHRVGMWLLTHARYEARMMSSEQSDELSVESFRAVFNLQTYGRSAHVQIPFSKQDATWPNNAVRLDGRPVPWRWSDDLRSLQVAVAEPGRYQLSVEMKPTVRKVGNASEFVLNIPPLHDARLDLSMPVDAPPVKILTARGTIETDQDKSHLTAHLGATERLVARWSPLNNSTRPGTHTFAA